jgi:mannose-6-phosphate isomerase-like protein (cupin superfamily)
MQISRLADLKSFITLDGSAIRELAGPAWTAARNQSLAEATVPAGGQTAEHLHRISEEIYYFVSGQGRMRLDDVDGEVMAGDCVVIPPGTPHKLWAAPDQDLVLLCACAPAYRDDDTLITEPGSGSAA